MSLPTRLVFIASLGDLTQERRIARDGIERLADLHSADYALKSYPDSSSNAVTGLSSDAARGCASGRAWRVRAAARCEAKPRLAGIRHLGRQRSDACCHAVFERSGLVRDAWSPLTPARKARLCRRFNVDVVQA